MKDSEWYIELEFATSSRDSMGLKIEDSIFKAYDVRGIYPKDLDEKTAQALGEAFGEYIGKEKRVAIGMDVRLSSPALKDAALKGMLASGLNIVDLGIVPTPVIYFAIVHFKLDGGMMITASHNPKEWNGFKFYREESQAIGLDSGMDKIRDLAKNAKLEEGVGEPVEDMHESTIRDYETFLYERAKPESGLKVAIDPGNGSYSELAGRILSKVGVTVKAINDKPDGSFPTRNPEPKPDSIKELRKIVSSEGFSFGVAFDADGDRIMFVDDKGDILRGDTALALLIKHRIKKGEKVVYEVSCSMLVEDMIKEVGAVPILTKVGRTHILNAMFKNNAVMGGEIANHLYFSDTYYCDDGLYAALKMAEVVSRSKKRLSELVSEMPHYETTTKELEVEESKKFKIVEKLTERLSAENKNVITMDGIKVVRDEGWFILRASNTTPMLRMVAESKSKKNLEELVDYATKEFEEIKNNLD